MKKKIKKTVVKLPDIKDLVIGGFIINSNGKKVTLNSYCEENNINRRNAYKALQGTWSGKKGKALRLLLLNASKKKG